MKIFLRIRRWWRWYRKMNKCTGSKEIEWKWQKREKVHHILFLFRYYLLLNIANKTNKKFDNKPLFSIYIHLIECTYKYNSQSVALSVFSHSLVLTIVYANHRAFECIHRNKNANDSEILAAAADNNTKSKKKIIIIMEIYTRSSSSSTGAQYLFLHCLRLKKLQDKYLPSLESFLFFRLFFCARKV